ncbi:hypothetical protein Tco_0035270, partial [Tanacetum coccineum]
SKFQVKPKKPIWQVISKKNSVSSSGTKKNSEVSIKLMSPANPFDALNTIEEGDELGSNGGSSNSDKKVVQDMAGSASSSPSKAPLIAKINDLESQMIEGKLVLLDDEGKSLKPSKSMLPSSSVSKKLMIWLIRIVIAKWKRLGAAEALRRNVPQELRRKIFIAKNITAD